jgi:hypothetical protein
MASLMVYNMFEHRITMVNRPNYRIVIETNRGRAHQEALEVPLHCVDL